MKNKIKDYIRTKLLGYNINTLFFSQGGEDAILFGLFRKKIETKSTGVYIDIGAYHPISHSNTFLFYRENWRGINIDARPGSMQLFNKLRPKDTNLEIGIGLKKELKTYFEVKNQATLNSFYKENILKLGIKEGDIIEHTLEVDSLENILDRHLEINTHIDFMSIDVEGLDLDVLKSNNWKKYKPSVLVIEMDCKKLSDIETHEICVFLKPLGYNAVAKNIIVGSVGSVFFVLDNFEY